MPLCKIQPSTGVGKEQSWEGTGAFGKIKKKPSVSDIRAQSLEQSEEMRSEHRPGEGVGRCFQKKSRDIPAFVLIRSHLEDKLGTPVSREKPLREPLL